jgi:hypothetical protein
MQMALDHQLSTEWEAVDALVSMRMQEVGATWSLKQDVELPGDSVTVSQQGCQRPRADAKTRASTTDLTGGLHASFPAQRPSQPPALILASATRPSESRPCLVDLVRPREVKPGAGNKQNQANTPNFQTEDHQLDSKPVPIERSVTKHHVKRVSRWADSRRLRRLETSRASSLYVQAAPGLLDTHHRKLKPTLVCMDLTVSQALPLNAHGTQVKNVAGLQPVVEPRNSKCCWQCRLQLMS